MHTAHQLLEQCSRRYHNLQAEPSRHTLCARLGTPVAGTAPHCSSKGASRRQLCLLSSTVQGSSHPTSMVPANALQHQTQQYAAAKPAKRVTPSHTTDGAAAAAAAAAAALGGSGKPKCKRPRRTDSYAWCCPACGNRFAAGGRLMDHMTGCCADLLPSQLQPQQQQQQGAPAALCEVEGPGPAASSALRCSDAEVQQLLVTAAEREQALRMRLLRLMYVADPGGGVAAVQQPDPAGAEDFDDAEADSVSECSDEDDASATAAAAAKAAAADSGRGRGSTGRSGAAAEAAGSSGHAFKRRRRQARPPLRSLQQLMVIMQLPRNRVTNLMARAPRSIKLVADAEPLHVVHEDAHFLAVLKPAGLRSAPVHRFAGGSALNRMIGHLGYEPHLLHRLDMNTSGVLLAAKDRATAAAAHAQFRAKSVAKAYLAIALGVPSSSSFSTDGPIGQHPAVKVARQVVQGGQPALTHMEVLASNPDAQLHPVALPRQPPSTQPPDSSSTAPGTSSSRAEPATGTEAAAGAAWGCAAPDPSSIGRGCCLLCCRPVTGRTHQIRVHMASAGHPLLGDEVYGLQGPWIGRQALHAWSLTLQDPGTGRPVTFSAPPPDDFAAAAAALALALPPCISSAVAAGLCD